MDPPDGVVPFGRGELRQSGIFDLAEVQYVRYQVKGGLTVVRRQDGDLPPLVVAGLRAATGFDRCVAGDADRRGAGTGG